MKKKEKMLWIKDKKQKIRKNTGPRPKKLRHAKKSNTYRIKEFSIPLLLNISIFISYFLFDNFNYNIFYSISFTLIHTQ